MHEIKVKSVAEYLEKIKKYRMTDGIFRGERAKYSCIQSGMFRGEDPRKNSWMIQQYYNLVGNSLTELQKEHFTSFSQHYGIPTSLIDFTTSPLVALFFACQNDALSECGYVYFIDNGRLIDIENNVEYINRLNLLERLPAFSDAFFDITVDFVKKISLCVEYEIGKDKDNLSSAINYYIELALKNKPRFSNGSMYDFSKINFNVNYKNLYRQFQLKKELNELLNEQQCISLDRVFKAYDYFDME